MNDKDVFWESGLKINPLYTKEDLEKNVPEADIGLPGEYPFTRGIHKLMYRKQPFTIRQYAGFGTPEETHERFLYLIKNGQTGLNVAFDLPTQTGLDSDDNRAVGEVGRVGMAVDTLADFETVFKDIDLDKITVSLTINGSAIVLVAMYLAMAQKFGFNIKNLRGTAQNDILKEFIGRGTWIFPVPQSVKIVVDIIEYCAKEVPKYSPVSVCGYHIRESGANPVQEMAYAFCIAKAYINETLKRGITIDEFASRLSFNFDIHGNFFEQIAKFRGSRRLWAKIIKEEYNAKDDASCWLRMIAGGGGGGLTKEQPENNIIRSAYYALISALSGTQTMALCSYDEAYTIPTEKAAEGKIQEAISRQAYQREKGIQEGKVKKVGVNCFIKEEEVRTIEFHPYHEENAMKQLENLKKIKNERDNNKVSECLDKIKKDAQGNKNLMPSVIEAVKAYATVGEITDAMKEVYGEYEEKIYF